MTMKIFNRILYVCACFGFFWEMVTANIETMAPSQIRFCLWMLAVMIGCLMSLKQDKL